MSLKKQALDILALNDRGTYTIPTQGLYPHQWNWDSVFIALGIATYDSDRAWTEILSLLEGQWPDGMIPSIIFRSDEPGYFPGPDRWGDTPGAIASTGVSQPPVLATIVRQLTVGDQQRRKDVFDQMFAWHAWFHDKRGIDGLITNVHPWETGRDNCPEWDIGLDRMDVAPDLAPYTRQDNKHSDPRFRPTELQYDKYISIVQFGESIGWDQRRLTDEGPFLMGDPNLHFILLRANRDLLAMAKDIGKPPTVIAQIEAWIEAGLKAADRLWNPELEAFTAIDVRSGTFSPGFSNCSGLCFYADAGSVEQRSKTLAHLDRINADVNYMLPSWDPNDDAFEPQRYWCGPLWAQMNYLTSMGLREQGYAAHAMELRCGLIDAIEKSGFWECFDPMTGEGCVSRNFSWTAAIWLAWDNETQQQGAA